MPAGSRRSSRLGAFTLAGAILLPQGIGFTPPRTSSRRCIFRSEPPRSRPALGNFVSGFDDGYSAPLSIENFGGATSSAVDNDRERPDASQVAAIAADSPAILLVAGAGTGKTRVLAARLAHILRKRTRAASPGPSGSLGVPPTKLMTLVLSFTSSAAAEICEQAAALPGGSAARDARVVWHGTFHSFAVRPFSPRSLPSEQALPKHPPLEQAPLLLGGTSKAANSVLCR